MKRRKPQKKFTGPMRVRGAVGPAAVEAARQKRRERERKCRERKAEQGRSAR